MLKLDEQFAQACDALVAQGISSDGFNDIHINSSAAEVTALRKEASPESIDDTGSPNDYQKREVGGIFS